MRAEAAGDGRGGRGASGWRALAALAALALVLRVVVAGFINVVSHDGAVFYLPQARALADGDWQAGFTANIPLLYPLLTALGGALVADLEVAGKAVSVLAGTLTLVPVFLLGRTIGGVRVGLLGAALAAVCPLLVRYSGHAQSDALFGLLAATAFALGWRLVVEPGPAAGLAAGVAGGLATLVRPEAFGLIPVLAATALVRRWRRGRGDASPAGAAGAARVAAAAGVFILALGAATFPQVWITHERTGRWTLSAKAGAIFRMADDPTFHPSGTAPDGERTRWEAAFGEGDGYVEFRPWDRIAGEPGAFARRYLGNLGRMLLYLPRDLGVAIFVVGLVAGLVHLWRGDGARPGEGYLLASVVFFVAALPVFYVSRRMWVPLLPLLLPLVARRVVFIIDGMRGTRGGGAAAAGVVAGAAAGAAAGVADGGAARAARQGGVKGPGWRRARLLLVVIFSLSVVQAMRPVAKYGWSWGRSPEKEAGAVVRALMRGAAGVPIMSLDGRVAWYARGRHVPFPALRMRDLEHFARARGVRLVAFEPRRLARRRPGAAPASDADPVIEILPDDADTAVRSAIVDAEPLGRFHRRFVACGREVVVQTFFEFALSAGYEGVLRYPRDE